MGRKKNINTEIKTVLPDFYNQINKLVKDYVTSEVTVSKIQLLKQIEQLEKDKIELKESAYFWENLQKKIYNNYNIEKIKNLDLQRDLLTQQAITGFFAMISIILGIIICL